MSRSHVIIVVLQIAQIALLVTFILLIAGCASMNGLHYPNGTKNAVARWHTYQEHQTGVVR